MSEIIKRLLNPPFGTETSESKLMFAAADEIAKNRSLIETLVKALEEISAARWKEDGDLDDVCTVAERALAAAKEITQ